tara:strand:- start:1823 stop:2755 length:933 start_codon:yes stop_codon:yes gene_type:complete
MKKIAVLYAGLVRDYKICFDSFKKNIVATNPDYKFEYFLCLWDHTHPTIEEHKNIEVMPINEKKVLTYFNPRAHLVLDYREQKKVFSNGKEYDEIHQQKTVSTYSKERFINTFLMQMYGLKKCFEIFQEHSTEYDYILKNRFDFFYYKPCLIPTEELESDKIYVLNIKNERGFVDNICLGKHRPMEIFMNTYDRLTDTSWPPPRVYIPRHQKEIYRPFFPGRNYKRRPHGYSKWMEPSKKSDSHQIEVTPQPVTCSTMLDSPESTFEINLRSNNVEIYKSLSWPTWKYGAHIPPGLTQWPTPIHRLSLSP